MDNKSVERYAQQNFQAALREAFWRKAQTWLGRSCNDLLSFQEVFEHLKTQTQDNRSLQNVLLDHIVGSTGRSDDFDLAYYPRKNIIENRWVNVAKNQYLDRKLPPILLYKVGGAYFVEDGNHRISVARANGDEFIQANVIEFDISNLRPDTSCSRLGYKLDY